MESSEKEPDIKPQLAIAQASRVHYDMRHSMQRHAVHPSSNTPCYIHRTSRFEFKRMEQTFYVESLAVIICLFGTIQKYHLQGLLVLSFQHLCSLKARNDGPCEFAHSCKRVRRPIFLQILNLVALPIQIMHVLPANPTKIWDIKEIYRCRKRTEQHVGRLTFLSHYLQYEPVCHPQVMGPGESGGIGAFLTLCA